MACHPTQGHRETWLLWTCLIFFKVSSGFRYLVKDFGIRLSLAKEFGNWHTSMFKQNGNVANQREHLILLLANTHIRRGRKGASTPKVYSALNESKLSWIYFVFMLEIEDKLWSVWSVSGRGIRWIDEKILQKLYKLVQVSWHKKQHQVRKSALIVHNSAVCHDVIGVCAFLLCGATLFSCPAGFLKRKHNNTNFYIWGFTFLYGGRPQTCGLCPSVYVTSFTM